MKKYIFLAFTLFLITQSKIYTLWDINNRTIDFSKYEPSEKWLNETLPQFKNIGDFSEKIQFYNNKALPYYVHPKTIYHLLKIQNLLGDNLEKEDFKKVAFLFLGIRAFLKKSNETRKELDERLDHKESYDFMYKLIGKNQLEESFNSLSLN